MKVFFLASLLVVAVSASLLEEHAAKFQEFKTAHGKSYLNQVEETKRFSIFRDNLRSIEEHNALYAQGLVSYTKKITKFADQTREEFKAFLSLHQKPIVNATNYTKYVKTGVAVADSVDWRQQGQVTPVKDQGNCGACWSFSVTGSIEAAYYRRNGQLVSLSEQQLVDCSTMNGGCDGGYLEQTYPYVQLEGLQTEESYRYEARDGSCRYDSSKVVTKISDYVVIQQADENAILEAVATIGPVSIAMDATNIDYYDSGIFEDNYCSINGLNHGVLIVGYGSENGKNYWIVKNSWGTEWGEDGYFKILRGNNECGIAQDASYPIIY